jgi:hypothetical protein
LSARHGRFYHSERDPISDIQTSSEIEAASELEKHAGKRKWGRRQKPVVQTEPIPVIVKQEHIDMRLEHYRQAMAKLNEMKEEIEHHEMSQNIDRVKARYHTETRPQPEFVNPELPRIEVDLEKIKARFHTETKTQSIVPNQEMPRLEVDLDKIKARYSADRLRELADIAAARKQVLAHHEMDIERLKDRFKTASPVVVTATPIRHEIDRERLQARYTAERIQSNTESSAPKPFGAGQSVKKQENKVGSSGLFRYKEGWAQYVKNTMDNAMRDIQDGQKVPVTVEQ